MNIEIVQYKSIQTNLVEHCKQHMPDLKIDNFSRLMKKLIRGRDFSLYIHSVQFIVTAPFFVYYDLKKLCSFQIKMLPIKLENIGNFELSEKLTDVEEATLVSIYKKIKSIASTMDNSKIIQILPMCSHIRFFMILDIMNIYELMFRLSSSKYNCKMKEFSNLLMKNLNEIDSDIFNEELLKVYQAGS